MGSDYNINIKNRVERQRKPEKGVKILSFEPTAQTIETYFDKVRATLPSQILGLHTYHCTVSPEDTPTSGSVPISSLIIIDDATSLIELREAAHQNQFVEKWLPLVIPEKWLPFYLSLRPILSDAIGNGRTLGSSPFAPLSVSDHDRNIELTQNWFQISSLVTPAVVPEENHQLATETFSLMSQVYGIADSQPQTKQLADLSKIVLSYIDKKPIGARNPSAPAFLPQLMAVYADLDSAILVVPDATLTPLLNRVSWQDVFDWLPDSNWGYVISESQFHYLSRYTNPIDFKVGRYKLRWGDPLIDLNEIEFNSLIKSALRDIFKIGVQILPEGYIKTPDRHMSPIIHDIQNHLLRIHLQFDLMKNALGLPDHTIGSLQAPSEWSTERRIDAIINHIEAWLSYYHSLLVASPS